MNINVDLFRRFQPEKKLEMINKMTQSELLSVSPETVKRIIKEAGTNRYKSRNKELKIARERRVGNNWNSDLESVELYKGKLYVGLYVQYGDCETDTTEIEEYAKFFKSGEYLGQIKGIDRCFNPKYYYFRYDSEAKAECMRSILLEYVNRKYADKLKEVQNYENDSSRN